jgi:hypothetical protein
MSISISNYPVYSITNKASYDASTSLVEGASYNNVRIRASLYVDGDIAAIVEQPKGLNTFNFNSILDSLCGKFQADFKNSAKYFSPMASATNLFTGAWVNVQGLATFTSSNETDLNFTANATSTIAWARSTSFALNKGDVVCMNLANGGDINGTSSDNAIIRLTSSTTVDAGVLDVTQYRDTADGGIIYLMARQDIPTCYIWVGGRSGSTSTGFGVSIDVKTRKIAPGLVAQYNRPNVYYKVIFDEYYEDANFVTQTSGNYNSLQTILYVPAKNMLESDFVATYTLSDTSDKFLSNSIGEISVTKHFKYNISNIRLRIMVIQKRAYTPTFSYSKDAGAYTDQSLDHGGWFVINVEPESLVSALTSSLRLYASNQTVRVSVVHELEFASKCFSNPVILDFQGRYGNETIVLNGLKNKSLIAETEKFRNKYGMNLNLSSITLNKIIAETNYQSEEYYELLSELLATNKPILMYTPELTKYDYDYCLPVEIVNDEIETYELESLSNQKIELKYYNYMSED